MEIIKLLGDILANEIKISQPAARGLLKLSIKDELGPFKLYENLSYEDFRRSIMNALSNRLKKLNFENVEKIIEFILNKLNENQSLITIAGV